MCADFVQALIECLNYVLRGEGSANRWLAIPTQSVDKVPSWKAATWTIMRWGSSQAIRDVQSASVLERLLCLYLSLETPARQKEVLTELTEYLAVAVSRDAANPAQKLFRQILKAPVGVPIAALEANLKRISKDHPPPSAAELEIDLDVQMILSRDFFRFLVAAPTLLGSAFVCCKINARGVAAPLLVQLYRTSFSMIIKSYVAYARSIGADVRLVPGAADSSQLPPSASLVRRFLVQPFADGRISAETMLGPYVAQILDRTRSDYFAQISADADALISCRHIVEFLFATVTTTPNDHTLLSLFWKLWDSAAAVFALKDSSPTLLLSTLRFVTSQLDYATETATALQLLELLSSKLVDVRKPSGDDLALLLADNGESLTMIYTRAYDAAKLVSATDVLRPRWLGIAGSILRALVCWEPDTPATTERVPTTNGELVLELWSAIVEGGVSFLYGPTLHTIVVEVAKAKRYLLLESLLLDDAHTDNLTTLCATPTVFVIANVLGANWGSFRHALRLASKFLHITSTSPSRSVLHSSICDRAATWLLGLPAETSAPLSTRVADSMIVGIARMLSETPGLVSVFVGALIQLATPQSLMWVGNIQEQLCERNESDGRNTIAAKRSEILITPSFESTLFRFLDQTQLRDQAASVLRVLRGVSFGGDGGNTTLIDDDDEALNGDSADQLFHETETSARSGEQSCEVVASLAVASQRSPQAVNWLKDGSKGWFGDATIAEQLQLKDMIHESSDFVLTETTKKNMMLVAQSLIDPTPILLVGESGTSKTYTVCQTATLLQKTNPKLKLLRINMHSQMTDEEFFGKCISTKSGEESELELVLQPFARAYEEGHWILLDEVNLASAIVFVRLESALSTDSIVVNKRVIWRHPDFRLFATMNPDTGKWADKRNKLSAQFVNLFRVVQLKALPKDEWVEVLQHAKYLNDRSLAARVVDFVKKLQVDLIGREPGNYGEITIRELLRLSDSVKEVERRTGECRKTVLPWVIWCVFGARYRQSTTQKIIHDAMEQTLQMNCSNDAWIDKAIKGSIAAHATGTAAATIRDDVEEYLHVYALLRATVELTLIQASFYSMHGLYVIPSVWWCSESVTRKLAVAEVYNGEKSFTQRIQRDGQHILNMVRSGNARDALLNAIRAVKELTPFFAAAAFRFEDNAALRRTPIVMTKSMTQYWRTLYVAMQLPFPLLVTGGEGQGKASLLMSIATVLRHPIEVYNLTPETESNELMGQYVASSDPSETGGKIAWVDGKVTEAVRGGNILLLTNVSGADAKLLERLNPVLERDPKLVLQEHQLQMEAEDVTLWYQHRHGGEASPFRIFSTLTTSQLNNGMELSPALFNRYTIVNIEPPRSWEEQLANLKTFVTVLLQEHPSLQLEFFVEDDSTRRNIFTPLATELVLLGVSNRMIVRVLKLMLALAHCVAGRDQRGLAKAALAAALGTDGTTDPTVSALVNALGPLSPHRFELVKVSDQYVVPTKHINPHDRIVSCIKADIPVLLEGPPSTGKTELIRELSRVTSITGASNTLENVINSSSTSVNDYWGSHSLGGDGAVVFCDGPLARALRHGYWLLIDELNLALPEVLNTLLAVMDGALFATNPITQEQVPVHPSFRLFATQIPITDHGRSTLPDAIVKRFASVLFTVFEIEELEQIIRHCFPVFAQLDAQSPPLIAKIMHGSNGGVTMRHIRKWANRLRKLRSVAGTAGFQFILDVGSSLLPPSCVPHNAGGGNVHNRHSISDIQPESAKFRMCGAFVVLKVSMEACDVWRRERDISKWPAPFVKSLVELAFTMHCSEPVLLVGPPSFKSLLVRTWSQISGQRCITSYLTRETEVADLIGSVKSVTQPQMLKELQRSVSAVRSCCSTTDPIAVGLCDELLENARIAQSKVDGFDDAADSREKAQPQSTGLSDQVPVGSALWNLNVDLAPSDEDWSWDAPGALRNLNVDLAPSDEDWSWDAPGENGGGQTNPLLAFDGLESEELRKSRYDDLVTMSTTLARYLDSSFTNHALLLRVMRLAKELASGDPDQPAFLFVDGPILQATSEGLMLLLEDFDGVRASTIERFNPLVEAERRLDVPEDVQAAEVIRGKWAPVARKQFIADAFQLVGTARAQDRLSPATMSRFTIVSISPYSISEMHTIVRPLFTQANVPADCVALFERLEEKAFSFCSMTRDLRRLERWAAYICDGSVCGTWRLRTVYGARVFYCEGVPRAQEKELLTAFYTVVGEEFLSKDMTEGLLGLKAVPAGVKKMTDFFCKNPDEGREQIVVTSSGLDLPKDVKSYRIFEKLTEDFAIQLSKTAFTPSVVELFEKMFSALSFRMRVNPTKPGRRCPLLLVGPPGRGKTKFAQFVAELLGYGFRRFNFSGDTSKEDIFGSVRPVVKGGKRSFAFTLGELAVAVEKGSHVILLDELNLANTEVLDALAMCLDTSNDDLNIPESGHRAFPLDDIVFIAAIKSSHVGGGREPLPRSIANLFTRVELDAYTFDELRLIGDVLLKPLCAPTEDGYVGFHKDLRKKILDCFQQVNNLIESKEIGGGQSEARGLRDVSKVVEMIRSRSEKATALQLGGDIEGDSEGEIESDDDVDGLSTDNNLQRAESKSFVRPAGSPRMRGVSAAIVRPTGSNRGHRLRVAVSERLLSRFLVSVLTSSFRDVNDRRRVEETIALTFTGINEPAQREPPRVTGSTVTVGTVTLARSARKPKRVCQEGFIYTEETVADLESIMSPISAQRPVLVCGSLASGKTSTIMEIARLCNREVLLIGGHSELDVADIIGTISPDPLNAVERMHSLALETLDELTSFLLANPALAGPTTGSRLSELQAFVVTFNWSEALLQADSAKQELLDLPAHFMGVLSSATGLVGQEITDVLRNSIAELESLRTSDWKPGFDFQRSAFVDAMYSGKWVIFDNVNAAPQNVVERLLPLLEEEPMLDLYESGRGTVLRPRSHRQADPKNFIHPDFRLFFTADLDRVDCPKPSAAFIDRLIVVHFDSEKLMPTLPETDPACGDLEAKYRSTEMFAILAGLWASSTGTRDDAVALEITRYYTYAAARDKEGVTDRLISASRLSFRTALQCLRTAAALVKKFSIATHSAVAIAISQTFIERACSAQQDGMYAHLFARASKRWPFFNLQQRTNNGKKAGMPGKNVRTRDEIFEIMKEFESITAITCGYQLGNALLSPDSVAQLWQASRRMLSAVVGSCESSIEAFGLANVHAAVVEIPAANALSRMVSHFNKSDDIFSKLHQLVRNASYSDCLEREVLCRQVSYAAMMCASALEPIRNTARDARELLRAVAKVASESAELLGTAEPVSVKRLFRELKSVQGLDRLRLELEREYWRLQIPACGFRLRALLHRDAETKQLQGHDRLRHVAQMYAISALSWSVATLVPLTPETPFLLGVLHHGEALTACINCLKCFINKKPTETGTPGTLDPPSYRRHLAIRLLQFSLVPHWFGERAQVETKLNETAHGIGNSFFDFVRNDLLLLGSNTSRRPFVTLAVLLQLLTVTERMGNVTTIVMDGRNAVEHRQVVARVTSIVVVVAVVRSGGVAVMQLQPPSTSSEEKPVVTALCYAAAPKDEAEVQLLGCKDTSLVELIVDLGCAVDTDVLSGPSSDIVDSIRRFYNSPFSSSDMLAAAERAIEVLLQQAAGCRIDSDGLLHKVTGLLMGCEDSNSGESLLRDFLSMRDSLDKEHAPTVKLFSRLSHLVAPLWSSELRPDDTAALKLRVGTLCSRVSRVIFNISLLVFAEGGLQFSASSSFDSISHLVAVSDILAIITSDPVGVLRKQNLAAKVRDAFHAVLPHHPLEFGSIQLNALVDDLATEITTAAAILGAKRGWDAGGLSQALRMRRDIIQDLDRALGICDEYEPLLNQETGEIACWKAEISDAQVESWTDADFIKFRDRMPDFGARVRALAELLQDRPKPTYQPDVQLRSPTALHNGTLMSSVSSLRTELAGAKTLSLKEVEDLFSKIKTIAPPMKAEVHTIPIDAGKNYVIYAAVAQSPHIRRLVNQIVQGFREMLSKCRSQGLHHHFRWVLFVDNSRSLKKCTSVMRLCVLVLMEALRKLEVEFNVYGFWQKLSKLYEARDKRVFDFQAGQRVLEGLVFEGDTSLISCLHEALDQGFGTAPPPKDTHNMLLMLSHCFTDERDVRDVLKQSAATSAGRESRVPIGEALRHRQVNMSCLNIGNKDNESIKQLVKDLTGRHGTKETTREACFTFASIDELEHRECLLPQRVIGLVNKQTQLEFAAIEKEATGDTTATTYLQQDAEVRVKPADITLDSHLLTDSVVDGIIRMLTCLPEKLPFEATVASSAIRDGNFTFERDPLVVAPTRPRKPKGQDGNVRDALKAVCRRAQPPPVMRGRELAVDKELHKVTSQCRTVIDDIFSYNRYTRKQPSRRGFTLSIRGLVRAIVSKFTDTRFFATNTSGGVRDYNFVIALDTSVSMRGPSFVNAVACTLAVAQALRDSGIERFSVVMYGAGVRVVKTASTPWDSGCKAVLLSARCDEYETNDAEMIRFCCEELLKEGKERHLFVFTDGFTSSSRTDHGEALHAARSSHIEVTAFSCEFEDSGGHESYGRYLTLRHPMELSAGLKLLFSDAAPIKHRTEDHSTVNVALEPLGEKGYDPLQLQDMLRAIRNATYHEAKIVEIGGGGAGGTLVVDVAFCLDLTASMTPFLRSTVKSIIALATALSSVDNGSPLSGATTRFGVACFRGIGEDQGPLLAFLPLNTTPPPTQEQHLQALKDFLSLSAPNKPIQCGGGKDIPEDIAGGLKRATTLFVRGGVVLIPTANRFLVLLSDAPSRGRAFHIPCGEGAPTTPELQQFGGEQLRVIKDSLTEGGSRFGIWLFAAVRHFQFTTNNPTGDLVAMTTAARAQWMERSDGYSEHPGATLMLTSLPTRENPNARNSLSLYINSVDVLVREVKRSVGEGSVVGAAFMGGNFAFAYVVMKDVATAKRIAQKGGLCLLERWRCKAVLKQTVSTTSSLLGDPISNVGKIVLLLPWDGRAPRFVPSLDSVFAGGCHAFHDWHTGTATLRLSCSRDDVVELNRLIGGALLHYATFPKLNLVLCPTLDFDAAMSIYPPRTKLYLAAMWALLHVIGLGKVKLYGGCIRDGIVKGYLDEKGDIDVSYTANLSIESVIAAVNRVCTAHRLPVSLAPNAKQKENCQCAIARLTTGGDGGIAPTVDIEFTSPGDFYTSVMDLSFNNLEISAGKGLTQKCPGQGGLLMHAIHDSIHKVGFIVNPEDSDYQRGRRCKRLADGYHLVNGDRHGRRLEGCAGDIPSTFDRAHAMHLQHQCAGDSPGTCSPQADEAPACRRQVDFPQGGISGTPFSKHRLR